jgi:hypothetical protein
MGLLDGLFDGLASLIDLLDDLVSALVDPAPEGDEGENLILDFLLSASPVDDFAAVLVDDLEQQILNAVKDEGQLNPGNVQTPANELEGTAASVLGGIGLGASTLEAASLGQIDSHTEYLTQAVVGLGFDDVTGLELDARVSEGIMPALEAQVKRQHTPKFADVNDAVEILLRNKQADFGFISDDAVDPFAQKLVQLDDPVDETNVLEHYGLREDQLGILEAVAIEPMEFEELVEQPAELGLAVPDDIVDAELDRAGYAEATKDFLKQVNQRIVASERFFDELTAVRPVIEKLDELVASGELSPSEATARIPSEVSDAQLPLSKRFNRVSQLPPGKPSRAQLIDSFARGGLSRQELEDELDESEFDTSKRNGLLDAIIIDELDGDLQESVALGLVDENTYSNLCQFVGFDQQTTDALLQGQSLSDITSRRLKEQTDPGELPVTTIQGIGESRAQSLELDGIEDLDDLATETAANVAEITNVSESTAAGWISAAQQAVQ